MLHIIETSKTVQEVEKDFPEAAAKYQFGVLGVHNLRQKMNEREIAFTQDCIVFEVCDPRQAQKVLREDMMISTALPCRVSVYQEGGKTKIATIRPTSLLELFGAPKLRGVALEVEQALYKIMDEAAKVATTV